MNLAPSSKRWQPDQRALNGVLTTPYRYSYARVGHADNSRGWIVLKQLLRRLHKVLPNIGLLWFQYKANAMACPKIANKVLPIINLQSEFQNTTPILLF